jgi:hypothetical protein
LRERAGAEVDTPAADAGAGERARMEVLSARCAPTCVPAHMMLREGAGAHVQAANGSVDAGERAGLRERGAIHPCPPRPCTTAPVAGAGVREEAGARLHAGNVTVAAHEGAAAHGGLHLGRGCRVHPGDPNDPSMLAGRRAHALQEAVEHLHGSLARLQSRIDATGDHLLDGNLTDAQEAALLHRLAQLERLQDHLLARLQHVAAELQELLQRWDEPQGDGGDILGDGES